MENSKKGSLPLHHGIKISKDLCLKTNEELDRMSRVPYALVVGTIMYAMTYTRPDISFALRMLEIDKDDSRSQYGWVLLLNGGAVTWKISKQDTVADFACESKYIAACEDLKEAIWMKNFIRDLGVVPTVQDPIEIYYNNESAIALTKEPKDHEKSKHIERKYHFIRSKVEEGHMIVNHIRAYDNPADPFTKALAKLLVIDTIFKRVRRRRVESATPRILWKNLNGNATKAFRSKVTEGASTQIEAISTSDAYSMWNILASIIKDAVKDSLGVAIRTSSMMHKSGRIVKDVSHRIKAAWLKWRAATGVLCNRNVPLKLKGNFIDWQLDLLYCMGQSVGLLRVLYDTNVPLKLKGKFYKVAIRPSTLYGSECWPITIALANRMEVAELRMLRRRPQSSPVRRVEALVVDDLRRKGRPKLKWKDRMKLDMKELLLFEDMASDRNE
nr:hypothetical protein [Tanacetum cinerariifolium]